MLVQSRKSVTTKVDVEVRYPSVTCKGTLDIQVKIKLEMKRTEFQLVFVNCELKCSRSALDTPVHFPWYFHSRRNDKSLINFKDVLSFFVLFFLFRQQF